MSTVGFPLLLIPFAIYNIIAFLMPSVSFSEPLVRLPLVSGAEWPISLSDVLLTLGILLLLLEVMRGARPGGKFITDHLLSLLVFGGAAAQFVMLPKFGTSTYFLLVLMAMVDFLVGVALRGGRVGKMQPAPRGAVVARGDAKTDLAKTDLAKTDLAKADLAKESLAKESLAKESLAKESLAKEHLAKENLAKENLAERSDAKEADVAGADTMGGSAAKEGDAQRAGTAPAEPRSEPVSAPAPAPTPPPAALAPAREVPPATSVAESVLTDRPEPKRPQPATASEPESAIASEPAPVEETEPTGEAAPGAAHEPLPQTSSLQGHPSPELQPASGTPTSPETPKQ